MLQVSNLPSYHTSCPETMAKMEGGMRICATTPLEAMSQWPMIREFPALQMALRGVVASSTYRQAVVRRILDGEVSLQGLAAALIALDAELFVTGPIRERSISLAKYLTMDSVKLRTDEVITDFFLPKTPSSRSALSSHESSTYQSVDYLRSGQAVCGVAAWARKSGNTLEEVRIVLSGCTQIPVPLKRVSDALRGKEYTPSHIEAAIRKLGEERLTLYNPELTHGNHLFNLAKTLIKRALIII